MVPQTGVVRLGAPFFFFFFLDFVFIFVLLGVNDIKLVVGDDRCRTLPGGVLAVVVMVVICILFCAWFCAALSESVLFRFGRGMWVETGAVSVFATKWSRFNGILFAVLVYPCTVGKTRRCLV